MDYKLRLLGYCKEYWNIENYELAKADNFKGWVCHHRNEIGSDGEMLYSSKQLIEMNLYYDRPSDELIFLTTSDHARMHNRTKVYKEIMSKAKKGHEVSKETRNKLRKSHKGLWKGMKWKVVNGKRVWYKEEE